METVEEDFALPPTARKSRLRTDRWNINPGTLIVLVVLLLGLGALGASKILFTPKISTAQTASDVEVSAQSDSPEQEQKKEVVLIYVSGEVKEPGVYELQKGSRIKDALNAALGATEKADLESINLAREVIDGEQIHIGNYEAPMAMSEVSGATSSLNCVDINRADAASFERLSGIGPALAKRIIDHRTEIGNFQGKEALMEVAGIGPKVFAGLENDLCG